MSGDNMIHFTCTHCGRGLKAPEASAGQNGQCPSCGGVFRVPIAGEAAPSAPPPPPPPPPPRPDVVKVACPYCGARLGMRVTDAVPGRQAKCARCQKAFTIPSEPAPRPSQSPAARPPAQPGPQAVPAVAANPPPAAPAAQRAPRPQADATPPMQPAISDESSDEEPQDAGPGYYPWEIPPERLAKAEAYHAQNAYQPFTAKVAECLNGLLKGETFKALVEAEFRVYEDMVGVTERPPGCLARLITAVISKLPGPIQTVLLWTLGGGLFNLLMLPFAVILAVITSPIWVPIMIFDRLRMAYVARKIRANPKSSYAIRKLFKYADLGPRSWVPGEIVQIVRIDTRRRLFKRSLIILVQDEPLPERRGCLQTGGLLVIMRLFQGLRRLYVVNIVNGPEEADRAAEAASRVLGAPVVRAHFTFNNLVVESAAEIPPA